MKTALCVLGVLLCVAFARADARDPRSRRGRGPPKNNPPPQPPKSTAGTAYCYWGTWAVYRPGVGAFGASDIPTDLCTHVIYSFIGLDAQGNITYDAVTTVDGKSNTFEDAVALREQNPELKVLVAVGGWSEGSEDFSTVANNDTLRAYFVKNVVEFIQLHDFDGLDVDWEYPAARGGATTDKEAFVWLLRDLRAALEPLGKELSVAVGVTAAYIESSYNVVEINKYVDHIVLMTYDYHGSWESVTGVVAPLYPQLTDTSDALTANYSVNLWLDNGADACKLLLGIAAYGKSFTLASLDDVGTGANATGAGAAGAYLQEAGTLGYYEICLAQKENEWNITEVTGNYVYGNYELLWVGYENANTIKAKGKYAKDTGLAGVSLWAIDYDDFSKQCSDTAYPIISSAVSGYNS